MELICDMPTYEYKCDECGIVFDRFQHFSEEPVRICPECGGPVHRVIQPVGIIFKGKGFYVTDHRGDTSSLMPKPKADAEASDKKAEATPAKASETKDSKETKASGKTSGDD